MCGQQLSLCFRYDRNKALVAFATAEFNRAVHEGKQGVILSEADVFTRVVWCATLANEDVSCDASLAAVDFYTQAFTF